MATINIARMIAGLQAVRVMLLHWRRYRAVIFSAALHTAVLVGMASLVLPLGTSGKSVVITLHAGGESAATELSLDQVDDELTVVLEPVPSVADLVDNETLDGIQYVSSDIELVASIDVTLPPLSSLLPKKPARTLAQVSSVDDLSSMLAEDVSARLQENDLLVVWLLDASHSVVDDRAHMVAGFESFFQHFTGRAASSHRLLNAVVSFGADVTERAAPTESHTRIMGAVRSLVVEDSGTENTLAAIEKCAVSYRNDWPDLGLLIVTWTDESGDDAERLEQAIEVCRANRVSVTFIGPPAVLGAETGVEPFTDPGSGEVLHLPVTRGPDSAVAERIELGYWFMTRDPRSTQQTDRGFRKVGLPSWFASSNRVYGDHKCIAATEVALPTWYGGDDLAGIVSGFGPYALTRLAAQTNGMYILFADESRSGPFQIEALRAYLPDYRAADAVSREIESRPLRRAVMEAVRMADGRKLGPPPTMLFGMQSAKPPFGFMRSYFTPQAFAGKLKAMRPRLKTQASRTLDAVEQALAVVSQPGSPEVGLEQEYEQETSRRWRAWYDVTRGRLLATSVRLAEYRKICDAMVEPGFIKPTTNFAVLAPSLQMRSSLKYRKRAEEAERLLLRCVRENPNTPWALLAQRELDFALGIEVRQFTTSLVFMKPGSIKKMPTPPKL